MYIRACKRSYVAEISRRVGGYAAKTYNQSINSCEAPKNGYANWALNQVIIVIVYKGNHHDWTNVFLTGSD